MRHFEKLSFCSGGNLTCVLYFFIFLSNDSRSKKLWKMLFIPSTKLFSFSRYSDFCNFFPSLTTFSIFKRTNGSGIIMMSWVCLHKLADAIFWKNSNTALYCIIKLEHVNTPLIREFFWTCFFTWKAISTSSRPLLFYIILSIKMDLVRKKIKLTMLRLFDNPLSKYLIFKRISRVQWLF